MYKDSQALQEYLISVCLNSEPALRVCMVNLNAARDFTGSNQKAFALIEAQYEQYSTIDPLVMTERFVNARVYDEATARYVMGAYDGDTDFEPKMRQIREYGVYRRAVLDMDEINKMIERDTLPDALSQKAMELVSQWGIGSHKKYYTAREVEQEEAMEVKGEPLRMGIPLLDDVIYRDAGQRKGTVKATIFREKHGKTRHACWEVAQDIRMGTKVLYITLEGQQADIKNNVKQVLQHEWNQHKDNLFFRDAAVDVYEIAAAITEWHFIEGGDKVVVDHMQRITHPDARRLSDNEVGNKCTKLLTDLSVKYDLNMHLINQARQPEGYKTGWSQVPKIYDCYGSNQLIKDASIVLVGFRPNTQEELIIQSVMGGAKVEGPNKEPCPLQSVFIKPILSRKKMPYLHQWMHFIDTDEGLKLHRQELIQ